MALDVTGLTTNDIGRRHNICHDTTDRVWINISLEYEITLGNQQFKSCEIFMESNVFD